MTAAAEGLNPIHQHFLVAQDRFREAAAQVDLALVHQAAEAQGGCFFRPIEGALVRGEP